MKKITLLLLTLIVSVAVWAQDPYFEITDGSYSSGKVTLRVTFPGVTTAMMDPDQDWGSAALRYGSTSLQYLYRRDGTITSEGNTISIPFNNFQSKMPAGAVDRKFYIQFAASDLLLDGERPAASYTYVRPKDVLPYAEVSAGSLTSGNMTVKVTIPYADVIVNRDRTYYYAYLLFDGAELAKVKGVDLTIEGNTVSATFNAFSAPMDNLRRCTVKLESYMLDFDGTSNQMTIAPFKGFTECAHANITSHAAQEPTTEAAGWQAYDLCEDCGKFFLASDAQHEHPVKWSAIEIEKICTHEGYWGEDDICSHCGAIREHPSRASKTWTMGGITVTYNPRNLSLTFSGSGYLPGLDYSQVVNGDYFAASCKTFPWYEELGAYETLSPYGYMTYKHGTLKTVIIEDGVMSSGFDRATYYLNVPVAIIRQSQATSTFSFGSTSIFIVENENMKELYKDRGAPVYTTAEAEALGYTSFPQAALQESCSHAGSYPKVPVCNQGRKNCVYEYCPVCGVYIYYDKYPYPTNIEGHNFNAAHKCTDCGMYDPEHCTHAQTTLYEAATATEEHPGHIAFQKCNGCGKYFAATDDTHSHPLDWNRQVLVVIAGEGDCEHETYTDGFCDNCGVPCEHLKSTRVQPQCQGILEFVYECDKCHLQFADAACNEKPDQSLLRHNYGPDGLELFCSNCHLMNPIACDHPSELRFECPGQEPNCLSSGFRSYFKCGQCGLLFESYYSTESVTMQDLFLPTGDHHYYANGVCMDCGAETPGASYCAHTSSFYGKTLIGDDRQHCTDPEGNIYYQCNSCHRYFYYPNPGNTNYPVNVTKPQIQIADGRSLHGRGLTTIGYAEATCTEDGHYDYKHCETCGRNYYFYTPDEECTIGAALTDQQFESGVITTKAHHTFYKSRLTATPGEDGFYSYACDNCDEGRNDYKILPGFNADGTNLVLIPSRSGAYSASSLKLDDAIDNQYCPLNFTASTATYTRLVGQNEMWGTICLPFSFSASDVTGSFKFYTYDSAIIIDDARIYKMKEVSNVNAGTPAFICKTVSGAETLSIKSKSIQTNWSTPALYKFIRNGLDYAPYLRMGATIQGTTIKSDASITRLCISGKDSMIPVPQDKEVAVPHFRAWFECSDHPEQTMFFLLDQYGSIDGILTVGQDGCLRDGRDIYDLSGRKLDRPNQGQINIIGGKKIAVGN